MVLLKLKSIRRNVIVITAVLVLMPVGSISGKSIAATQYFSVQLPQSWIYRQDYSAEDSELLIPGEFTRLVDNDTSKSLLELAENGVLIEFGRDSFMFTK